ncbi:filamentous hemagglutinin N-terminal domain-containing protein [Pleurocapsa sp. PCC 7319]|uniref:two-partner secretion domain-containing protein n=1 Tax=Pleurocapsa sp. PCC 7319 TaxID=118161 RepID=UPI00034DFDC1|nr:filamentous hemagglutinin N-terminal domain-containing protein [Pleurocapsa sp. PCC 7319]
MQKLIHRLSLVGSITLMSLFFGNAAQGQVSPDGTLSTNVDLSGNVFEITGGATEGTNLFHSFGEFSVPTNFEAFFNNGTIDNIISRVTGGSISNIDGLIRANNANLILINPAGISFGSGASLDIGGAFLGSSATSVNFEDGTVFSADPNQAPLLTVSAPIGVAFAPNPGNIQSQGANLTLESGNTFALIGGNVSLNNTKITAPSGNIEIGSVGSDETVNLTGIPQGWELGFEGVNNFQDIQITSASELASTLRSAIESPGGRTEFIYSDVGGDINIRGQDITIAQGTEATLPTIYTRGQSQAGDITIQGRNISISEGSQQFDNFEFFNPVDTIDADSLSNQLSGTIAIDGEQITIDNSVGITSELWNRTIQGEPDSNERGAIFIGTNTDGNRISINGSNNLPENDGNTQIITDTHGFHGNNEIPGTANNINIGNINSQEVIIQEGAEIAAESHPHNPASFGVRTDFDAGEAGSITIKGQQVNINGEDTSVTATAFGTGAGGSISLEGANIRIEDQAIVVAETSGATSEATGGSISIGSDNTNNEVTINNATVSVRTGDTIANSHGGTGQETRFGNAPAGNISIGNSDSTLDILNDSRISASTIQAEGFNPGLGSAGTIEIDADEFNLIQDAIVSSETVTLGNAGDIFLRVGSLLNIENGSEINVTASRQGQAGNIDIVTDSLLLNNEGIISSDTQTGEEGNITIQSRQAILDNNSEIRTDSNQTSDGGNITFTSSDFIALLGNSDITANAEQVGQGGVISIDTQGVFQCGDCRIEAIGGVAGIVDINTPEAQNTLEFLDIPQQVINSEDMVVSACGVDKGKQESQFTITGRGGLPARPTSSLSTEALIGFDSEDGVNQNPTNSTETNQDSDVEQLPSAARGWYLNSQGRLVLTASIANTNPYYPGENNPDCDSVSHNQ